MPNDSDTPLKPPREDSRPDKKARDKPDAEAPDVRVAGRKQMDLPPEEWDEVDEEVDESFPASDPPGNY